MTQVLDGKIDHPYGDEFRSEEGAYIERFQELLFDQHEPTQDMLDSLHKQDPHTLRALLDIMLDLVDTAEPEHKAKYQQVVDALQGI